MKLLATPLGYLLMTLYKFVGNYGIAIIIFTVIVKIALYPLLAKQIKSTAKMSSLSRQVQEIQQKYAKNQQVMQEKINELYSREGVSMTGGCLPMFIQMFVIMALFALLRNPMAYIEDSNMLFALHESFLWIPDMAQPDKWILPIAAAVTTFISNVMSQANNANAANAEQMKAMNAMMRYMFPLMILLLARSYPAGLALYWFVGQVVQIFFNFRFKKMREELNAEMQGKGKKKSKVRA